MAALTGQRILIVEDEALVAMDIEFMIEDAGGEVVGIASDNSAARGFIEAGGIDAVLLDFNLSDGEATPTAQYCLTKGVPIVFHSGHALQSVLLENYPGAQALPKPSTREAILDALSAACGRMADA